VPGGAAFLSMLSTCQIAGDKIVPAATPVPCLGL